MNWKYCGTIIKIEKFLKTGMRMLSRQRVPVRTVPAKGAYRARLRADHRRLRRQRQRQKYDFEHRCGKVGPQAARAA